MLQERISNFFDDNEALGSDTALPAVNEARVRRRLRRLLNVGVVENDERVASAQLEYGLLDLAPRLLGHFAPGAIAAGQSRCSDSRISNDAGDFFGAHEHRAEQILRESRFAKNFFDLERAARHVGGVLQNPRVPRHERRGGEAKDLPEGKVPRHDGEHRPQGIKSYVAAGCVGLPRLIRQKSLCVLRVVVTSPRTLLHFRFPLHDRFSHLEGHGPRIFLLPFPQDSGGFPHPFRALSEGTFTPFAKRRLCSF